MPEDQKTIALESWLVEARPRLHRLALLRGVPADAVEDVVQETLFEAWKHQDRLHAPEGVHLWLDEICRNICRRYARKHAVDQQRLLSSLAPYRASDGANEQTAASFLDDIPDHDSLDPLEALSRQDMALLLDRAFSTLSGSAREALELCYLLELPQREVAGRLGLSISALEARLHRARLQLRQALTGPLRAEAEALGLPLDQDSADGWRETRLWCALCGRRRLMGLFLPQPTGGPNLHMRCPECEQRTGLSDVDNSTVHSKGLVHLEGLQAFRPAWKRTMQEMARRLTQALRAEQRLCPYCGTPATLQLMDKSQATEEAGTAMLPSGLARHPYQFWVCWRCPSLFGWPKRRRCSVFAASDLVYWSHERTRRFMGEHPRWGSEPELLVEYAGQPAIRFQMADLTSAERLTVLAHRQTLDVLAVF